jgi:hypothetical protein
VRFQVRVSLVALVVSALVVLSGAPAASAAGFGIEKFFAGNCEVGFETCGKGAKEGDVKEAEEEGYVQSGGFVPYGVTDFKVNKVEASPGLFVPVESIKNLRVDVAPGVVTNPEAVEKCSVKSFTGVEVEPVHEPGVFSAPTCAKSTIIGKQEVETVLEVEKGVFADVPLSGKVYNLEQASGQGSTYGVALIVAEPTPGVFLVVHSIIQGSVEWNTDYHDYFVINNIAPGLLESRLVFYGAESPETHEKVPFVRNPTKCTNPGRETTTTVTAESENGVIASRPYQSLIGSSKCAGLKFEPAFTLTPESALSDQPDGITNELTAKHPTSGIDTADLESITVKMPEGMTMNPSAAAGLQACTPSQAGFAPETRAFKIQKLTPSGCSGRSKIGTFSLEVPTLPEGALQGSIYLGQGENAKGEAEPITKPPYTVYLDARTSRYGIRVLLKGTVTPNPTTGQMTATFNENPQAPFNSATLHFNGGAFAPIANPLVCGAGKTTVSLASFSTASLAYEVPFTTEGCSSTPPAFAPTQSTSTLPSSGASEGNFTFTLTRPEGQQYVEKVSTVLPPGLVGKIPSVPLCSEAQASATQESGNGCSAASLIGTARVLAGSGEPYAFTGNVYLTGPYNGAPYGLAIKVPVAAGPFKFTEEVTRATISVDPHTARVIVASTLPTIKEGIPIRVRSLTVDIDRPNYILNPTNCGVLATESTVTSTLGATALVSSPFQAEGCGGLAFKPTFTASTSGKPSKANGASLVTTITQAPGQANIGSVFVQLPKQLPSRLTTLQKACLAALFEANPFSCSKESEVGTASAVTPVLPNVMKGPAYLVSHGGEAFPDLELVLEANGVRVIVDGKTDIKKGITTTNFKSTPDVPVSSVTVNLPLGPHSALATERLTTNLCTAKLVMPTTITGQNGKVLKQNTVIAPTGCGVQIIGQKVVGNTIYLTIKTFAAGRISGSGSGLTTVAKTLGSASNSTTLKIPLSKGGRSKRKPFKVKVRVGFLPKKKGAHSTASVTVKFR